jgi:hypothetical protein
LLFGSGASNLQPSFEGMGSSESKEFGVRMALLLVGVG